MNIIEENDYADESEIEASEFDLEVCRFHNKARTKPKSLIPLLEEMLTRFDGKLLKGKEDSSNLETQEGAPAVRELIEFLKK
jgi:hypothetical protein